MQLANVPCDVSVLAHPEVREQRREVGPRDVEASLERHPGIQRPYLDCAQRGEAVRYLDGRLRASNDAVDDRDVAPYLLGEAKRPDQDVVRFEVYVHLRERMPGAYRTFP